MDLVDVLGGVVGAVLGWASGAFKARLHVLPRRGALKDLYRGHVSDGFRTAQPIPAAPEESRTPPPPAIDRTVGRGAR